MNLQEKYDKAVEEFNNFAIQLDQARKQVEAGEQERLMKLGRIQQLEELLKEETGDRLKEQSKNGSASDEAEDESKPEEDAS